MRAVISRVKDDRVVSDAKLVELLQHLADVLVMRNHHIVVFALAVTFALMLFGAVGAEVHSGGMGREKKRLPGFMRLVNEFEGALRHFIIDRLHAFLRERPGVLDFCPPLPSAQLCKTPRGPKSFLNSGSFG